MVLPFAVVEPIDWHAPAQLGRVDVHQHVLDDIRAGSCGGGLLRVGGVKVVRCAERPKPVEAYRARNLLAEDTHADAFRVVGPGVGTVIFRKIGLNRN
jgi:hypothetical protein